MRPLVFQCLFSPTNLSLNFPKYYPNLPVPPDKSLPYSPTPAIDTQIATVMRDNIDFPT